MKNNNVREADMWCIRRKGTQPMSKTGYCGIDKIVMDFMETSSPNEEKELFGEDMFFILDWKKELPLYLDEEGYFDVLGRPVENPTHGFYIRRSDRKKVFIH